VHQPNSEIRYPQRLGDSLAQLKIDVNHLGGRAANVFGRDLLRDAAFWCMDVGEIDRGPRLAAVRQLDPLDIAQKRPQLAGP
jgi:hypothetical protein